MTDNTHFQLKPIQLISSTIIKSTTNPELEFSINISKFDGVVLGSNQISILALDTATETCVVALLHNGLLYTVEISNSRLHALVILEVIEAIRCKASLELTQLACIGCGVGPGSFTGVRVASSVVQALAVAIAKPVVGISTLKLIAATTYLRYGQKQVLALLDARKHELYWGVYGVNPETSNPEISNLETCNMELIGSETLSAVAPIIHAVHNLNIGNTSTSNAITKNIENIENIENIGNTHTKIVAAGIYAAYYKELLVQTSKVSLILEPTPVYPSGEALIKITLHEFSQNLTINPAQLLPVYLRNNVADVPT